MPALDQQGILQIVALVVELLKHIADQGGIKGQDVLVQKLQDTHAQVQEHLATVAGAAEQPAPSSTGKDG